MSVLYELPSETSFFSQPSAEWVKLLESDPPDPPDSLNEITTVREKRIQLLKAYLASGPKYIGETNVQVIDSTYPSASPANITLPIRIYTPADDDHPSKTYPVLLWFHGGGFIFGSNLVDDELLRYICHHSHIVVVTAGYRLSPEHPFPAAPNDAWAAAQWVRDNADNLRVDANRKGFYIGGISAGANLAAVVARRARDHRESEGIKIDGQLLGFPWLCSIRGDYGFPANLMEFTAINECADAPWLSKEKLLVMESCVGLPDPQDPEFSPLWDVKELKGLPRAAIFVAGMDPLRDDGIAYWKALEREGPNPRIRIYPGLPHAFQRFKMEISREFKKHMAIGLGELVELRNQHNAL